MVSQKVTNIYLYEIIIKNEKWFLPFSLQIGIKSQINQVVKGKIMINIKNPNQLNIFDPWDFLTPKRRKMLDNSWPGLFREHILPSIPVHKVAKYFDETFGRPTKELYAMIGALVLQQTLDLTDEETVRQYAFDTQWHYALNVTEESDKAKYISLKTLWNNRNIVAQNNLEDDIFKASTKPAIAGFQR